MRGVGISALRRHSSYLDFVFLFFLFLFFVFLYLVFVFIEHLVDGLGGEMRGVGISALRRHSSYTRSKSTHCVGQISHFRRIFSTQVLRNLTPPLSQCNVMMFQMLLVGHPGTFLAFSPTEESQLIGITYSRIQPIKI